MNENELVNLLKEQLKSRVKKILIHKFPSNSPSIRDFLRNNLSYLPSLRPEIDMIFLENTGHMNAVEVKFFKSSQVNDRIVFCRGLDQALALHRYGFDNVALWHFFASDVPIDDINKYGSEAWFFIRNSMQLKLNFSYFKVINLENETKFQVLQYVDRYKGFSLERYLDDPEFVIIWRYGNPLLLSGDVFTLKIREALFTHYFGGS